MLFENLSQFPWINTVTIQSGGILSGKVEKRHFYVDRMLEAVAEEREINLKRLDRDSIALMRERLEELERS